MTIKCCDVYDKLNGSNQREHYVSVSDMPACFKVINNEWFVSIYFKVNRET